VGIKFREFDEDGGRRFLDAVLDNDMKILFNDSPEKTRAWLLERPEVHDHVSVGQGETMHLISVNGYLGRD
jgi:hypothetical protein